MTTSRPLMADLAVELRKIAGAPLGSKSTYDTFLPADPAVLGSQVCWLTGRRAVGIFLGKKQKARCGKRLHALRNLAIEGEFPDQ